MTSQSTDELKGCREALKACEEIFMRYEINRVDGEEIADRILAIIRAALNHCPEQAAIGPSEPSWEEFMAYDAQTSDPVSLPMVAWQYKDTAAFIRDEHIEECRTNGESWKPLTDHAQATAIVADLRNAASGAQAIIADLRTRLEAAERDYDRAYLNGIRQGYSLGQMGDEKQLAQITENRSAALAAYEGNKD